MPVKTPLKQVIENIHEQGIEPIVQDAANQFKPMGSDLVKMLYWSDSGQPANHSEINKKSEMYKSNDQQQLEAARKKHADILGSNNSQNKDSANTNIVQDIIGLNPSPPKTENKKVMMEHHSAAQELGQTQQNEASIQKKRQEQQEEEERLAKERARQESLNTPIEAQGKQTGGVFGKRKNSGSKMTKPPISTETRGANNRE